MFATKDYLQEIIINAPAGKKLTPEEDAALKKKRVEDAQKQADALAQNVSTLNATIKKASSTPIVRYNFNPNTHTMITFGYQVFKVSSAKVYTVDGLSMEWGKELESQGQTGKKPITYISSKKLVASSFRIHASRFVGTDPDAVRKAWSDMAENANTYGFLIGKNFIGGKFVVKSVKMENTKYNGDGLLISADFDISVEEYAGNNLKIGVLQQKLADYS